MDCHIAWGPWMEFECSTHGLQKVRVGIFMYSDGTIKVGSELDVDPGFADLEEAKKYASWYQQQMKEFIEATKHGVN